MSLHHNLHSFDIPAVLFITELENIFAFWCNFTFKKWKISGVHFPAMCNASTVDLVNLCCHVFFESVRKVAKSDHWLRHVCLSSFRPSVRIKRTQLPLERFSQKFIFEYFSKNVEKKIQNSFKPDKNMGYFVGITVYRVYTKEWRGFKS